MKYGMKILTIRIKENDIIFHTFFCALIYNFIEMNRKMSISMAESSVNCSLLKQMQWGGNQIGGLIKKTDFILEWNYMVRSVGFLHIFSDFSKFTWFYKKLHLMINDWFVFYKIMYILFFKKSCSSIFHMIIIWSNGSSKTWSLAITMIKSKQRKRINITTTRN